MKHADKIRNIAIIAHIDHGKTTLLDSLLRQSKLFRDNQDIPERVMDSYDQEKERGITIFAKHTAIPYEDFIINVIDTPGHADFSGEVERILGMVSCVLLLVDAQDGPMPQTRFVLSKSLALGLKPIVVINKVDRPSADPDRVLNETFDLFTELGATDEQLDFRYIYASGLTGFAKKTLDDPSTTMDPLFELIVEAVPAPGGDYREPFLLQAATVSYDDFLGRQITGKILRGTVKKGQTLIHIGPEGKRTNFSVTKIQEYLGLKKVDVEEAYAGDIIILSGLPEEATIGDTVTDPNKIEALPSIHIGEPTLSVDISVNSSPFVGKSGKHVTMNKIKERLLREKKANISLRIEFKDEVDKVTVAGRGELHLSVLIESMRREGYEFSVSKPRVLTKEENGVKMEPVERVYIETPEIYSGKIIEEISKRKGEMQHLETTEHGISKIEFLVPTRGLMGLRSDFLTMTRGLGIMTSLLEGFTPWKGEITGRIKGVLVSGNPGRTNGFACFNLQDRGTLFVKPGDEVYEGMVVGENSRDNDMIVNVTKAKQLTNVRASGSDENIILTPPRVMTLEQAINFIADDELVEITPAEIRLRKIYLTENERKRKERGM